MPEPDSDQGDIPLEPFNLDEERQTGRFEDDGFYVEAKVDPSESDAWLKSSEATICSIDVLRKHAEQQEAMAAAEKLPKPSMSHTMELKKQIVAHLAPRETVLAALRRLAKKKSPKDPLKAGLRAFEELTELADGLLNCGEMDAYSLHKEEFEHSLETMGYKTVLSTDDPPDTNDIFAEESDQEEKQSANFESWSIPELKAFLTEHQVDCSMVIEKRELIEKAQALSQLPPPQPIPQGFIFHAESGYYYHSERGLYYDGASSCFYDPRTTQWFDKDWKPL